MSAAFFLKYREQYVRLVFLAGRDCAQIVGRDQATPFTSEADAWLAAHKHHLRSDWCEVVNAAADLPDQTQLDFFMKPTKKNAGAASANAAVEAAR